MFQFFNLSTYIFVFNALICIYIFPDEIRQDIEDAISRLSPWYVNLILLTYYDIINNYLYVVNIYINRIIYCH